MTHPTFTDMRDFALATAQRFASIPDDTSIVQSLWTPYGGCAVGIHFDVLPHPCELAEAAHELFPAWEPFTLTTAHPLWDIVQLHDHSWTVGEFKGKLAQWLAEHPYIVEFPIVAVHEQEVVIPHG